MLNRAWEWVFGPDPGLLRLRAALRTAITAAATLIALLLLQRVMTVPIDAIGLGLMISIFAGVTVRDPVRTQQRLTLALVPWVALCAWAVSATLSRWPALADFGFVLTVSAAGLARRWGTRGMALGMVAFIAYFISEVTRSALAHYRPVLLAVGIAALAAYAGRLHLLPDDPRASFGYLSRHMRRRIGGILGEVAGGLAASEWPARLRQRLARDLARLAEAAVVGKQQIDALHGGPEFDPQRSDLRSRIFHVTLATERLVRAVIAQPPTGKARDRLWRGIADLRLRLRDQKSVGRRVDGCCGSGETSDALADFERALDAAPVQAPAIPPDPASPVPPPEQKTPGWLADPALRQAIQNAVAVGAAIGIGSLVSGRRWYWAALAAFVVGANVGSRGEGIVKAAQRLCGTLVGAAVGLYGATWIGRDTDLVLALLLVCIFFAYYAFQAAYGVMIFWITILVSLLYGLLGLLKPELLLLRLEETAVGSAIAVAVMATVLPMRKGQALRDALVQFVAALQQQVAASYGGADDGALLAAEWRLAENTQALHDAVGPMKRGWSVLIPRGTRVAVRTARRAAFLAHELAHALRAGDLDPALREAIRRRCRILASKIEDFAAVLDAADGDFRCRANASADAGSAPELTMPPMDPLALIEDLEAQIAALRQSCGPSDRP